MKIVIATIIIFFGISTAYSQSVSKYNPEKFIERFSAGAGLGAHLPVGNYKIIKESILISDLTLQYKISKDFSAAFNIDFENDNPIPVSYLNFSTLYNYLDYKNTLLPYFEIGIGTYYGKELLVKDYVWMYYSERKSYFGGSVGTGLDIKLSPYAALDFNVKYHSFDFGSAKHFFSILNVIRFNL